VEQRNLGRYNAEQFLTRPDLPTAEDDELEVARNPNRRMNRWAIGLALATVASTFLAGIGAWSPQSLLGQSALYHSMLPVRQAILANWSHGLQFSLGLMLILVAHEFGHYLMTIRYGVPSTPPLFIPFPLYSPFGTMGAVIMMQSGTADRKQIFDIGLAGPLAGLVVAIPLIAIGILNPNPIAFAPEGILRMGQPLIIQWMAAIISPETAGQYQLIANNQATPLLMAGWVGLLVTGINMMPLGQLDGGHVTFGLLGKHSIYVARAAFVSALAFMIYNQALVFALMMVLVLIMGLRHPPSSDDSRPLGIVRQVIGWMSLIIPILCVPANPITIVG
jgi:membrane-associated protease RseP (regulator of RpoE activity)